MNHNLRHRLSIRLARKLVGVIAPYLRPEERWEAFQEFSFILEKDLERFEVSLRNKPPKPSRN